MKTLLKTAAVAIALATAAAPVAAQPYSQLAANAGLSPSEAAGLTLTQIATIHFNRGESYQDRTAVPGEIVPGMAASNLRASARNMPGLSLRELAAIHHNCGMSDADKITVVRPTPGSGADRTQLAASAGVGVGGADRYDLTELARLLSNRGLSGSDRQGPRF
jgi:hypothetical protein